jgi:membrane associated rhomboid family serine protease
MGIYDREYYRDEPRRPGVGDWSAVTTLIVINVAIWVIDQFTPNPTRRLGEWLVVDSSRHWLDAHMQLLPDLFTHPWQAWQLLTYGFAHDPNSVMHILFNMFGLWLFGRDVEAIYGRKEFYRIYVSLLVLSGLGWVAFQMILAPDDRAPAIGASGAIMGITMIYILHYPYRMFLFMFAIPVPAWALGVIFIAWDVLGATGRLHLGPENVANTAHLAGAFFGFVYYRTHWTLFSLWPGRFFSGAFRRPKYRVHRGDDDGNARGGGSAGSEQRQLQQQVDDILAKISREGEASLTSAERRTLEEASRKYRGHRPGGKPG